MEESKAVRKLIEYLDSLDGPPTYDDYIDDKEGKAWRDEIKGNVLVLVTDIVLEAVGKGGSIKEWWNQQKKNS